MSKPLIVVVLLLAALASAGLVFFAMNALSQGDPPPTAMSNEPTTSAPMPEPEVAPTDAELLLRTDITDANLFVDAFDRGPIEAESRRTLPLGPHRIEARRGATVIAAITVELAAGGADVELHADGTTAQTARPEAEVRVAVRTRGEPTRGAEPEEPSPATPTIASTSATTITSPASSAAPVPPSATETPTPTTVAAATPRPEPPPGVEAAPTAPIFAPRPSVGIQVVDQNPTHTVTPPPTQPVTPTRVAAPVAPGPPPTEAQMRRALDSVLPAVRTCAGDFHGELDVSVSFAPDGATRARIGRLPTREARLCVQSLIHDRVEVPAFTGRGTQIRHVYRL